MKSSLIAIALLVFVPGMAMAKAEKLNDFHWTGVERVVAIGDLHGDYEQYLAVMRSAGLVDRKGKWTGGATHLVQTGDITDRGADSRKIIDHLRKLERQASRKGGYIHMLIGNHESMNVIGDLRYVHEGEFQAFKTRNSPRLQEMQWQHQLRWMQQNTPDEFAFMDIEAFRKDWETRVPLGWVEHRQAWALSGDYGQWVRQNPVAVQVNDSIFLHGGISAKYCKFDLASLTAQVVSALENYDPAVKSIIDDPLGPLWYRGLATEVETEVYSQTLDNILDRYGIRRIVIGHTPTGGIVWPRFDQRVIVNDTGIAGYYGSHTGVLELTEAGLVAIHGEARIPIPAQNAGREDYLRQVIEVDANNALLKNRLKQMQEPASEATGDLAPGPVDGDLAEIIPGTCQ